MTNTNDPKINENRPCPETAAVAEAGSCEASFSLDRLYRIITDRKNNPKPGSYTTYLFDKGVDKILKKIGEETTEVVIAGKAGDKPETIYEISDLVYHVMVLMADMGIRPAEIIEELASRHGQGTGIRDQGTET